MVDSIFWKRFDLQAAPRLSLREVSFRKIFQYLDTLPDPITIVETGCARMKDNWEGDGQSTILFDWYALNRGKGSLIHTIDLNKEATDVCRTLVSQNVIIHTGDSVNLLPNIGKQIKDNGRKLDLLYLDSYDLDWTNPTPSAVHHLKELTSIAPALNPKTLVVIDDSAMVCRAIANSEGKLELISPPLPGGKSTYVAEYATQIKAHLEFAHYQIGWTNMVAER